MPSDTVTPVWIERPPHVHPTRMLHIDESDLLAAVGMPGSPLAEVRKTLCGRGYRPSWDPNAITLAPQKERDAAIALADGLLDRDIDFADPAAGKSQLYALNYLLVLAPLVSARVLTGEAKYVRAWDRLFMSWYESRGRYSGGWPGLDLVWYSVGVWLRGWRIVDALSVFGDDPELSDTAFTAMLGTLVGGARWTAEEHGMFRRGNWQLDCSLELFHIAAFLPDAPERDDWLAVAQGRLADHLELDFYADGGHYERSPSYHHSLVEYMQRAAIVGEQYLGLDLTTHPRFVQTHRWLLEMATPQGWVPHWQDSALIQVGKDLLRGAYLTHDAQLAAAANSWLSREQIERELAALPTRPGLGDPLAEHDALPAAEIPERSRHLATSGYVILAGQGGEPYLALNAGPYAAHELETHSHDAVLDIVLSVDGRPLIWEGGCPPSYDDPEYYDWYKSGRGHSGITVPGRSLARDRQVRVERFEPFDALDVVRAAHHGYGRDVIRQILMVRGATPYYLMIDYVESADEPWEWTLISPHNWASTATGFRAGETCGLTVALSAAVPPSSIGTGSGRIPGADKWWEPNDQPPYDQLYALRLRPDADRLVSVLAPHNSVEEQWSITPRGSGWEVHQPDGTVDSVTESSWLRRSGDGAVLAGCGWSGSDGTAGADSPVAGRFVQRYEIDYADGMHARVTSTAPTFVRFACPPADRVWLNGVSVEVEPTERGIDIELVSPGTWTVDSAAPAS